MLLEMHSHTAEHSSCSHVSAEKLTQVIYAKGLQGVVFTDHHYLWPAEEIREIRQSSGVPDRFLIFSGQEVQTRDVGDVLVFGADQTIPSGWLLEEVRTRYPEAAIVWAHPYRRGNSPSSESLLRRAFDGVEILNSNHSVSENSRALKDWYRYRFTATAGTDTHGASYAGVYPTYFDHAVESIQTLAEEIKKGRCRPFLKAIPKGGIPSEAAEIIDPDGASPQRIIIKSARREKSWKSADRAFQIMEALYKNGFGEGMFRVPKPIDRDEQSRVVMEEQIDGMTLVDTLIRTDEEHSRLAVQSAARWLAKLHNARMIITPPHEFIETEERRLRRYVASFEQCQHPHTKRAEEIMLAVKNAEDLLFRNRQDLLIQGHGDYHPKNILISQSQGRQDFYVAAIDFDSSYCLPQAFDVGTFLAQYQNQLFPHPDVLQKVPEEIFLNTYLDHAERISEDFLQQVELFRVRTNLCIASYLIYLGLGHTENLWRVLVEAEKAMAQFTGWENQRRQASGQARNLDLAA